MLITSAITTTATPLKRLQQMIKNLSMKKEGKQENKGKQARRERKGNGVRTKNQSGGSCCGGKKIKQMVLSL
jgi:hypothetical protein